MINMFYNSLILSTFIVKYLLHVQVVHLVADQQLLVVHKSSLLLLKFVYQVNSRV